MMLKILLSIRSRSRNEHLTCARTQVTGGCGRRLLVALLAIAALGRLAAAERFQLVWPTPSRAWAEGRPTSDWLQHAGSGDPHSGGFGGVRSGGAQFHEGIDIKPVARDRKGEALDDVFAAMAGVVRHVSRSPGDSSYGRYLVLEHPDMAPAVYTLYAHLARISPDIRVGTRVDAGQTLGTMGRSSGGYTIPKERAHLHFEVGVALTQNFQLWYARQRFGSKNEHGMWNGMNLMGLDPVAFYDDWRAGRISSVLDFFRRQPAAARVRIATMKTPDFVQRYPSLLTKESPMLVAGWEIQFTWNGLPFAWTPLSAAEVQGLSTNQVKVVEVNADLERRERSKSLAVNRRGTWTVGRDLRTVLELLFGAGLKL